MSRIGRGGAGRGPDDRDRDLLVEQAVSAWRPRDLDGGIRSHPAWADLDDAGRDAVFTQTLLQRRLEASLRPDGLSATGAAVMERIRGE